MPNKPTYEELENRVQELEKIESDQQKTQIDSDTDRERLYSLLNTMPGFVYLQARDYSIRYFNKKFAQIFNEPGERPCYKVIAGIDKPCKTCPTFRLFNGEGPQEWEWTHPSTKRIYQIYDYPFIDFDGSRLVLELGVDITDRKESEDALRDSKVRLKALSEAPFESIFFSEKGICLDQNKAAERMFGYTRAEAIGRHGTEWVVPEDREQVKNNMLSGYEKPYEVTAKRKDGTTFPCEIQARMIDYQGRAIRVTALRDITDHKQAEDALRKAHDELERRVEERTKELERQKRRLEDVNTALNVMLNKRDEDKLIFEERVLFNVKELVDPLIENLKNSGLNKNQTGYVHALENFLAEIVSPFSQTLHTKFLNLTPSEIRVANLVKEGKTTKEIAHLLKSTPRAIEYHRQNLRKKLGLTNRKANLASHLLSLLK